MRVYTYHERPGASALTDEPVLLREGFNWAAALFSVLWALWHGMWLMALVLLVAVSALEAGLAFFGADALAQAMANMGLAAIIGFSANDWRRATLRKRGYRFAGVVAADTIDSAYRRWVDLHPAGGAAPQTSA